MSRGLSDLSPSAQGSSGRVFHRSSPQSSTRFPSRCSALSSGRSLKTILKPAREAVFATATLSTGTPVASRRAEQSHNLSQTGLKPALDRSSPRPPCPQVPQGHSRVAKPSSIIPSPRTLCPQVLQCHPHVPNNHIISLKPASNRTSTGPRHSHPTHRYLSAIPACRSRHLSSLRHGHPTHRYSSAIPTCRTIQQSLSNRPLIGLKPDLDRSFATATPPTGTPVPSPRAETSQNRSLKDVLSGF